ncbi:hypothetical protein C2E20_2429 [Micractinium conductrix]|uniref:Protein SirB1 N-terminal domain-containing protein n=1 Tax=Micractinium conductrix TaxID=554055 RepID=A0A2P6VL38_9CHLO|nr:hypothetical protein C2E20_2429 [Micractinium conductrix]|eukprot:PSC74794.1 hypothetical protein C2E20_2429 [Micractinium conductrix]
MPAPAPACCSQAVLNLAPRQFARSRRSAPTFDRPAERATRRCGVTERRRELRGRAPAAAASGGGSGAAPTEGHEHRFVAEEDPRYRRVDFSAQHAWEARRAFVQCIARGEAAVDLSAAALHVAAEDDALVSHSSVQLPVASYQQRLQRMASELAAELGGGGGGGGSPSPGGGGGGSPSPGGGGPSGSSEAALQAIQAYLYGRQRFRVASRSNLPAGAQVDHPGVWERASHAYLNEVLTRRQGTPAALAVVLADLVRRLLLMGAIDFAIKIDCRDLGAPPRAEVLPLPRDAVVRSDGTVLNTCSTEALAELLRHLKRCFWPFAWEEAAGSGGGFTAASRTFLEGEADAAMQAISRTAKHRLERGIWTSPGAGDMRRALAACERLVLLQGDACPAERRDLAALYMHVGRFREAKAELQAFVRVSAAAGAAPAFSLGPAGAVVTTGGQSLAEQALCDRLLSLLAGVEAAAAPLALEEALAVPPPVALRDDDSMLPLTW